jgi:hypothetical protein
MSVFNNQSFEAELEVGGEVFRGIAVEVEGDAGEDSKER